MLVSCMTAALTFLRFVAIVTIHLIVRGLRSVGRRVFAIRDPSPSSSHVESERPHAKVENARETKSVNQPSKKKKSEKEKRRVAVIGGGIAGCSAAYALAVSGEVDVTLFEERAVLGGNAKTQAWEQYGGCRTGLSVLAWPEEYFRHYSHLLKKLGIPVTDVKPTFWIDSDNSSDPSPLWAHGRKNDKWLKDMDRWDRMVTFVRWVNETSSAVSDLGLRCLSLVGLCSSSAENTTKSGDTLRGKPSFYKMTLINPMNVVPLRFVSRLFGISAEFWELVVVPVYSSSFLTCHLNDIPAVILPALDDIISVGNTEVKTLKTWEGSSKDVFDALAKEIKQRGGEIILEAQVCHVSPTHGYQGATNGTVVTFAGGTSTATFDSVIFACPSRAVDDLTRGTALRTMLFDEIIPNVKYENERDTAFTKGIIHANRDVLPPSVHEAYFGERFSNYLKARKNPNYGKEGDTLPYIVENTFTLGTWVPQALSQSVDKGKEIFDCFVSYNPSRPVPAESHQGEVDNNWAHPQLSLRMMALARSISLLQGDQGVYFCGNYTTPGNGHDLSLLSGFVVANALLEGKGYPFADANNPQLAADFRQLQSLMGF